MQRDAVAEQSEEPSADAVEAMRLETKPDVTACPLEAGSEGDRQWFEARPHRKHRVRPHQPGEWPDAPPRARAAPWVALVHGGPADRPRRPPEAGVRRRVRTGDRRGHSCALIRSLHRKSQMTDTPPPSESFSTEDIEAIAHATELLDLRDRLWAVRPVSLPFGQRPSACRFHELLAYESLCEAALALAEQRVTFSAVVFSAAKPLH